MKNTVSYTAKKTRHKYRELYRVTFSDGIKKTIGLQPNGDWHLYITDDCFNGRAFSNMDAVAQYAHEIALKEKEWLKTHWVTV